MTAQVQIPVVVDRSSAVPLYHQVAEQLRAAVDDGRLAPGDPFENEVALAHRLGLSRPTIRRALQDLVDQGLLVRRRGLGTTVAHRRVHRTAGLSSLHDDLSGSGRVPATRVLELEQVTDARVAAELDLPPGTPLWRLVRLRTADGLPLALMHNWLPVALVPLDAATLAERGLYALLRERGVQPAVAHQRVGARMPTAAERRHLDLRGSAPVLTMTRAAFDAAGAAIELGDHSYRAGDYTIDIHLDDR